MHELQLYLESNSLSVKKTMLATILFHSCLLAPLKASGIGDLVPVPKTFRHLSRLLKKGVFKPFSVSLLVVNAVF